MVSPKVDRIRPEQRRRSSAVPAGQCSTYSAGFWTLNNGVGNFSITLRTAGSQTITATDTVNSARSASGPGRSHSSRDEVEIAYLLARTEHWRHRSSRSSPVTSVRSYTMAVAAMNRSAGSRQKTCRKNDFSLIMAPSWRKSSEEQGGSSHSTVRNSICKREPGAGETAYSPVQRRRIWRAGAET
jgi:hypothetical protein